MNNKYIEYLDVVTVARTPVQKQMWDGTKFVPIMVYRTPNKLSLDQVHWLQKTYGAPGVMQPGQYWQNGLMDEKIYMMFQLKWSNH